MTGPKPPVPRAAGIFIAFGLILGALFGAIAGQPSLGVIAGFVIGSVIALVQWRKDKRP